MTKGPARSTRPLLLLGAFAAIAAVGGVAFILHQRARLRRDTLDYLGAVANLKVHEYLVLLDERLGDAEVARSTEIFNRAARAGAGDPDALSAAWAQANTLKSSYEYRNVLLLDAQGQLLVGAGDNPAAPIHSETAIAAVRAIQTRTTQVVTWWPNDGNSSLVFDVVAPLRGSDANAPPAGVVVLRTAPEKRLLPLLAEWPLARPGEISLARAHGDRVFFFDLDPSSPGRLGRERPLGTPHLAEAAAVRGDFDAGAAEDDRGVPVLAAARRSNGWVIVAKARLDDVNAGAGPATALTVGWIVTLLVGAFMVERDRARRALNRLIRLNEERLRISQALARAGSWEWDLRRGTLVCSDELARLFGLPAGGNPSPVVLLRRLPVEDRRMVLRALRVARAGGPSLSLEHGLRAKAEDGSGTLRVQHEARVYTDAAGTPVRIVGVLVDVTQRRRAERALGESEAAFRNIFESMQDAFITVEFGGLRRVLRANPAAVRMLGYQRAEDVIGLTVTSDDEARGADTVREMLFRTGVAHNQRTAVIRADGTSLPVEANVRLIYDENRNPVALEGVVRDMTLHDRRQADLVAAREAALEAAQVKTRFLANMSHEIRTPLNAIVGLSHLLLLGALPLEQRDHVRKIQSSARTLLEIINSVLDYSKIEAGRLALDATPLYLDEVLDRIANLVAVEAQAKGLELVFTLAADVPPVVIGDPVRLGQVLTNLVNNAVKFTQAGEVVIGVETAPLEGNGATAPDSSPRVRLRFWVRDTGIGIEAEQIGRLFAPFTQADDSTTRRFGGTGLGLAITRQLVELMGGQIEVQSRPGEGSTFAFTIELGVGAPAAGRATTALAPATRALVVDDNDVSRIVLERYLREMTFDVETVAGGTEALASLHTADAAGRPFGLVLLDWRMPPPDGVETAQQIRAARAQRPPPTIVMVTAYGREGIASRLNEVGIAGVLVKPITRSVLFDAIASIMGAQAPVRAEPPRVAPRELAGARVLVVEDNEINQQVARELLASAGVDVLIAPNGRAAVDAVATARAAGTRLDAVLMDLQMPELDGYGATAALRKDSRNATLPIIAMTAHALELERARCLEAGMNDYVTKPVDPAVLYAVLGRWLNRALAPTSAVPAADAALAIDGIDTAAALRRLRGNRALLLRLLGDLAATWRDGAAQVRAHLARGAGDEARLSAHTLAGAAGNLGAESVAAAALTVEKALLSGDLTVISAAVDHLESQLGVTCAAIDQASPRAQTGPAA